MDAMMAKVREATREIIPHRSNTVCIKLGRDHKGKSCWSVVGKCMYVVFKGRDGTRLSVTISEPCF